MDKNNNSGSYNSGSYNSGDWNSGHYNSGNCNSGDCNSGNRNSGFFNTITPTEILVFNKLCAREIWNNCQKPSWIFFDNSLNLPKWVSFENMSLEDKKQYPDSEKLGGYLLGGIHKELSKEQKIELYKQSAQKAWEETTQEDRELTFKLPNFDADVFYEIFGIDVRKSIANNTNN